jgi:hypothetical protein
VVDAAGEVRALSCSATARCFLVSLHVTCFEKP